MTLFDVLGLVAGGLFAVAALLVTVRMVRGRSLLDRMIASDVLLTTVILVLGAEMVINGHTSNLVLMIVLAAVASFAAIAVARTVSMQDRVTDAESGDSADSDAAATESGSTAASDSESADADAAPEEEAR